MKIFVYGTLKRGLPRHAALLDQSFLGTACTEPQYRMVNVGRYPGLVSVQNGVQVEGEVWEVDEGCLAGLDEIEAVASDLFQRREVKLEPPYHEQRIEAYFYRGETGRLPDCGTCW